MEFSGFKRCVALGLGLGGFWEHGGRRTLRDLERLGEAYERVLEALEVAGSSI